MATDQVSPNYQATPTSQPGTGTAVPYSTENSRVGGQNQPTQAPKKDRFWLWLVLGLVILAVIGGVIWWAMRGRSETRSIDEGVIVNDRGEEVTTSEMAKRSILSLHQWRKDRNQLVYSSTYLCSAANCEGESDSPVHRTEVPILWAQSQYLQKYPQDAEVATVFHQDMSDLMTYFSSSNPGYIWQSNNFHCSLIEEMLQADFLTIDENDFLLTMCTSNNAETYAPPIFNVNQTLEAQTEQLFALAQNKMNALTTGDLTNYAGIDSRNIEAFMANLNLATISESQFAVEGLSTDLLQKEIIYFLDEMATWRIVNADQDENVKQISLLTAYEVAEKMNSALDAYYLLQNQADYQNSHFNADLLLLTALKESEYFSEQITSEALQSVLEQKVDSNYPILASYLPPAVLNFDELSLLTYLNSRIGNEVRLKEIETEILQYYVSDVNLLADEATAIVTEVNEDLTEKYLGVSPNGFLLGSFVK